MGSLKRPEIEMRNRGSLLRPLLQKEETLPATVITTHVEIETTPGNTASAITQKGRKRRRHDTGSSTKSDKSVCGLWIAECRGETRPGGANCSQFYFLSKKRLIPCEGAINLDPVFLIVFRSG